MLHLAISSLEPLPLETFMAAVNFVIKNKSIYLDPEANLVTASDALEGTEVAHLRRLVSRSGGLLETAYSTVDEATSAPDINTIQDESNDCDSYDSGNPRRSLHHPKATTKIVQFLHATAKEYIQDHRDQILGDRISKAFSGLNGYDFLLLCCVPWDHWVALIKKHMFYYAKMTERTPSGNDRQPLFASRESYRKVFYRIAEECLDPNSDKCDLRWLIQLHRKQHKGHFMSLFLECINSFIMSKEYIHVILAVLANARLLVEHMLSDNHKVSAYAASNILCLLQTAAAGPDLIPIQLNDRSGMIRTLVSGGYPVDRVSQLCTSKTSTITTADEMEGWTPLNVLLTGMIESKNDEDTKLAIVDCLLSQHANPNLIIPSSGNRRAPLAYCVQYKSVGLVRLLLEYGADPNYKGVTDMQPMHYALIRNDKAILQALIDHGCDQLRPEDLPDADTIGSLAARQALLMGSVGHPMVAAFSARGPRPERSDGSEDDCEDGSDADSDD